MPRRNHQPDPTHHVWSQTTCDLLAASLHDQWRFQVHSGPEKQETTEVGPSMVSTDRRSGLESPGGRYAKSA